MNNRKNRAFENEMNIVDDQWVPVNFIDWEIASKRVLWILKDRWYADAVRSKAIWWELDASQIEIKNKGPHTALDSAIDELSEYMYGVLHVVGELGYAIHDKPYVEKNYTSVHSWLEPHYGKIHDLLLSQWNAVRKGTNITWLHYHREADAWFEEYKRLSNRVHKLLKEWNYKALSLSHERHEDYVTVVEGLQQSWYIKGDYYPRIFSDTDDAPSLVLDQNGKPFDNCMYVQIKQPWDAYTWELRFADWASTIEWLSSQAYEIDRFYEETIATHEVYR